LAPIVALLAAMILLMLFLGNSLMLIQIHSSRNWIGQTRTVERLADSLHDALIDAETNERGLLLTGKLSYLSEFTRRERSTRSSRS
jgi:CHASE3 domain sensor protein